MGFHGQAAAYKPKITMRNAKLQLEWCKAHQRWMLEQWKSVLCSFTIWQTDESGLADARETLHAPMHRANCTVCGGGTQ
jgi:hypothetical protein